MIHGTVVGLQAHMSVILCLPELSNIEIECVIDTGFEGLLTLPSAVIDELGLPYIARIDANLADNSNIAVNVYLATILWNGVEREVAVLGMGRRPLIGTALLEDYHLSIDFCDGGTFWWMISCRIDDLQDEITWNESFQRTQSKLIAAAKLAKQEIAEGQATAMNYDQL
ncbi:clan AA aspartic protease [Nostoc sp.]|uniref:clan AA aspartic protease n=1 Tax=Nostoc sp. TaxID=1180 RepID=UPI002FFB5E25